MNQNNQPKQRERFHPTPPGCVARDLSLARALEELYTDELNAVASASYRSMLCEECDRELSELLYEQMQEEIRHFRFLGELILSLGGNPTLRTQIRVEPLHRSDDPRSSCAKLSEKILCAALRDKRRSIDRYQTMLGRTQDRVVRSLLCQLIDEEQRHAERLKSVLHDVDDFC